MFAKIFKKHATQQQQNKQIQQQSQNDEPGGILASKDIDPRVTVHYGIPSTASVLAFDPIQQLLAVGTLDGRIKVIGDDNVEGLLVSPKQLPFKHLEFLRNHGFLATVSNENDIQVWDLENRRVTSNLQWASNITAFTVIDGTSYIYVGDEYGMVSVLKYDADGGDLVQMPYNVPFDIIAESSGISSLNHHSVVGLLLQPCSEGNRLLVAYENGSIVLWDVSEDRVVLVRGNKDLQSKGETMADSSKHTGGELSDNEQVDKEISSLCWASTNGSIVAVGYVDGDIIFWNLSTTDSTKNQLFEKSSNNAVKLQFSSGKRRLPVTVLHWSASSSHNDCGGQLFVHGGDEVGSEVLTVLGVDYSSGIESLKCASRVDLTLNGSFADMALLQSAGLMTTNSTSLIILANPGNLHFYSDDCLSALMSQQSKNTSISSVQFPTVIPITEPYMTVGRIGILNRDVKSSRAFSEIVSAVKIRAAQIPKTGSTEWPLTGGVPSQLFSADYYQVERIYVAGYQDGSVRIWDATYPALSLIFVLGSELKGVESYRASASVSALEFCSFTLNLAVANECGMVRVYNLMGSSDETELNFVTETEKEVHTLHKEDGPQCRALFSLLSSSIHTLQFANFGARLAVGFECGRVAMLDITALSILYLTDSMSDSSSPVNSLAMKIIHDSDSFLRIPNDSESRSSENKEQSVVFVMTKDAHIVIVDSTTGNIVSSQSLNPKKDSVAIALYIIEGGNLISEVSVEKLVLNSSQSSEDINETAQTDAHHGCNKLGVLPEASRLINFCVLLCCEDVFSLYSLKSLIQGDRVSLRKVNLLKQCCWTTTFRKDENVFGLVVLYQTGVLEIRSLPNLEVVGEWSLMSILRWNFKTNTERIMCSISSGEIILVNGSELAFVSLLASENEFRIPESLPCLHDKVLAAAADATVNISPSQRQTQVAGPGSLGSIVEGFDVGKMEDNVNLPEVCKIDLTHLDSIFSSPPFLKPSLTIMDNHKVVELNIDDIEIDGPLIVSSSFQNRNDDNNKGTEKERLMEGATPDTKPRVRTAEEIRAKYRKAGDASSAAVQAKDKLLERQEKLQMLNERTSELQSGAENFASMANELVKTMEKRKWWHF
ncbi:Synaptobrevin domain-containing protein [Cephalotus follicularis]|uniref:Synaptobrevin domain-containing protein n=1 Tax=Cephalotus follicularis TaxID=3775 RepID=A0A1Q3C7L7_CEPFO|nr:Synaptobrevin domain-containing protein [Cephalotus follicularis]